MSFIRSPGVNSDAPRPVVLRCLFRWPGANADAPLAPLCGPPRSLIWSPGENSDAPRVRLDCAYPTADEPTRRIAAAIIAPFRMFTSNITFLNRETREHSKGSARSRSRQRRCARQPFVLRPMDVIGPYTLFEELPLSWILNERLMNDRATPDEQATIILGPERKSDFPVRN
jgi:hypothetical protein